MNVLIQNGLGEWQVIGGTRLLPLRANNINVSNLIRNLMIIAPLLRFLYSLALVNAIS